MREPFVKGINFLQNNFGESRFAEPFTDKCLEENKSVLLKLVQNEELGNFFSAFLD